MMKNSKNVEWMSEAETQARLNWARARGIVQTNKLTSEKRDRVVQELKKTIGMLEFIELMNLVLEMQTRDYAILEIDEVPYEFAAREVLEVANELLNK